MRRVCAAVTIGLLSAACDGGSSPPSMTGPSSVSQPVAAPQPVPPVARTLMGYVADTAFRVVAGVTVEVMQGPEAGTVMTSDSQGRFSYTGTFASPVTLRATKEGYAARDETVRLLTNGSAYVSFQLVSLTPPVPVATNYTLTISADPACTGLPDDLRSRTYAVTVTPNTNPGAAANSSFNGRASGQFAPFGNLFWIGVSGDYVVVTTEGEGPSLVEQVGTNRYVAFAGNASLTVDSSGLSNFSAPFRGVIEYCELKGPIGAYYDCRPELAAVKEECTSNSSLLTLVRR